jgi:Phage integrase central domain
VGLAEARKQARVILSDPDGQRRKRDTVADVVDEWLKRDQAGNRRVDEVTRIIGKDLLPILGARLIADIRKRDIIALIDNVADRGSLTMANRTLAHVKRLFRCARDILEHDPSAYVEAPASEVRRD